MAFLKNLSQFLNEAQSQAVIDSETKAKLENFAQAYRAKGLFTSTNILGFCGGLAIILGVVLLISSNWRAIPSAVKFINFIALLAIVNFIGYRLNTKYQRISEVCHFIGAGLVIAGIGLVAQIYHLSYHKSLSFFLWFILILPMAIILKNRLIASLAMIAFYLSNIFLVSKEVSFFREIFFYLSSLITSLLLLSSEQLIFKNCFEWLKKFAFGALLLVIYWGGFINYVSFFGKDFNLPITAYLFFISNLAMIIYFQKTKQALIFRQRHNQKLFILIIFLVNILQLFNFENCSLLMASIYWLIWFLLAFMLVDEGEKTKSKAKITLGVWAVAIGLLTRFFWFLGSMFTSGIVFVLAGVVLLIIAFVAEKYRKKLIAKTND
ncbi:MAG: DUF2157 domain-containing protein [Gemmatimonadota bacterium]|nr:DUF2157 domain-containing protein [Gemmatimonadota bacterium]